MSLLRKCLGHASNGSDGMGQCCLSTQSPKIIVAHHATDMPTVLITVNMVLTQHQSLLRSCSIAATALIVAQMPSGHHLCGVSDHQNMPDACVIMSDTHIAPPIGPLMTLLTSVSALYKPSSPLSTAFIIALLAPPIITKQLSTIVSLS